MSIRSRPSQTYQGRMFLNIMGPDGRKPKKLVSITGMYGHTTRFIMYGHTIRFSCMHQLLDLSSMDTQSNLMYGHTHYIYHSHTFLMYGHTTRFSMYGHTIRFSCITNYDVYRVHTHTRMSCICMDTLLNLLGSHVWTHTQISCMDTHTIYIYSHTFITYGHTTFFFHVRTKKCHVWTHNKVYPVWTNIPKCHV